MRATPGTTATRKRALGHWVARAFVPLNNLSDGSSWYIVDNLQSSAKIVDLAKRTIIVELCADQESLPIARYLDDPWSPPELLVMQRKRFLSHLYLNALEASFMGLKMRMVKRRTAYRTLQQILDPLLIDNYVFRLTQTCGYDPDFSRYCQKRRYRLLGRRKRTSNWLIVRIWYEMVEKCTRKPIITDIQLQRYLVLSNSHHLKSLQSQPALGPSEIT